MIHVYSSKLIDRIYSDAELSDEDVFLGIHWEVNMPLCMHRGVRLQKPRLYWSITGMPP